MTKDDELFLDGLLESINNNSRYKDLSYISINTEWKSDVFKDVKFLASKNQITLNQQFSKIYTIFNSINKKSVNDIQKEYCKNKSFAKCYPLDAIEANTKYKELLRQIVDTLKDKNKEIKSKEEIE